MVYSGVRFCIPAGPLESGEGWSDAEGTAIGPAVMALLHEGALKGYQVSVRPTDDSDGWQYSTTFSRITTKR
eukprot:160356-Pyramimonas_sp.AAC.3